MSLSQHSRSIRRDVLRHTAAMLGFLCLANLAQAQINTGRLNGNVRDASGAVVPEAQVTATNDATGSVSAAQSSDSGDYVINYLIPGTYHVSVAKAGFQRSVTSDVVVNAGGITRLDISLNVGEVQQSVEVAANPLAVATESSELSKTFDYKQIDQLPNIDRNPLYQMNLLPGANNDAGSGNYGANGGENGSAVGLTRAQTASLGGVDANANSVFIEGIFNREPQNAYIGLVPPIEAIEEVQVYTGKYNAEFGFSGSAVINVVTKSGTNEFHGALFEFLRNDYTDALNYFAEQATPFRRNQFGGALGGPVKKNRLFFFGDYQGTRFSTSSPGFTTAPTDKMYNGDFSELYDLTQPLDAAGNKYGQIYDPFSRVFDANGNVVSATPFPNNVIPQSQFDPVAAKMNADKIFGVANLPGISNNLYYLYTNQQTVDQGDGRGDYYLSDKDRFFYRYSRMDAINNNATNVNEFWQAGQADSNTVNQNMQLTYLRTIGAAISNELRLGYNRTNVHTSNKTMSKAWNNYYGLPNGNLGDPITQGVFEVDLSPLHNIGDPDWVAFIISNTIAVTENFTWVKGKHNLKFGTSLNHVEDTSADTIGGDDPRGRISFDPAMTSYDGTAPPYAYPSFLLGTPTSAARARFVGGWPYQTYWQNGWYAQDDFKVLPSLTLNLGLRYDLYTRPIERYNRESNWDSQTNQLIVATSGNRSPGLNLDKGDVGPRVGFAWSPDRGKTSVRGGYGISYWQAYWSGPLTILGLTYPSYVKQQLLTPNNLTPSLLLSRDGLPVANAQYDSSGALVIPDNAVIRGTAANWKNQRVDQGTLNVEREIRPGMVLDVGYEHVQGIHNNHTVNVNQAPPQAPGVDYNTARPLYGEYPQLGDVPVQFATAGSWYDALTASFTANITKYINVYATYAHARSFANGNNINPNDIWQYYGPTPQDIAHTLNAQVVVQLPVGRGRTFGANMSRGLDAVVGGWEYAGLIHVRSGTRFDVYSGVSLLNNGQGNRPDRICNGAISNPTPNMWFNPACFVDDTVPDTYGNAGVNPLYADGQQQLDSSFFKTFNITERVNLQLRADVFNTFNHPNFGAPDSFVGDPSMGQVFSTSVDNRRMQFGLRLHF
ncbi:MAG TPA: carboxypeptidase regulatory-like domain-containing protein [Bryobacteraceae bacterium]|nr:carboxypeptidase regulatory-like domain-containing protein [Bryobacteraceae bacterium]